MRRDEFRRHYGKIRVLKSIGVRKPVSRPAKPDRNRRLMLKFKYGSLSGAEEVQFHEDVKKLIYNVMHKGNVIMDWDDLYQEIWKKIVSSKHTWNENNGTMVSTWITIVAMSVMNTMRKRVNRYHSRYVLYNDLVDDHDEDGSSGANDPSDVLRDEIEQDDDGMRKMIFDDQFRALMDSLDECEREFLEAAKRIDAKNGQTGRVSLGELRKDLGYRQSVFNDILYSVRRKISEFFPGLKKKKDEENESGDSDEFLF